MDHRLDKVWQISPLCGAEYALIQRFTCGKHTYGKKQFIWADCASKQCELDSPVPFLCLLWRSRLDGSSRTVGDFVPSGWYMHFFLFSWSFNHFLYVFNIAISFWVRWTRLEPSPWYASFEIARDFFVVVFKNVWNLPHCFHVFCLTQKSHIANVEITSGLELRNKNQVLG